jgi:hypothetical protein
MGIRLLEAMYLFAAVMLLGSVIHFKLALQIEREQKAMATRAA